MIRTPPRTFMIPDLGYLVRSTRPALERNPGWAAPKAHAASACRCRSSRVVMNW